MKSLSVNIQGLSLLINRKFCILQLEELRKRLEFNGAVDCSDLGRLHPMLKVKVFSFTKKNPLHSVATTLQIILAWSK
jgi:hypothetical protein